MVLESGKLLCGCNYWASHAGMYMWRNWSAETVEEDLKKISLSGMTLLRVFPLWEDFQPVEMLRAGAGSPAGYARFPEGTFLQMGEDGLSPVMLERFRIFADLAEKHHLKLVVALLTGWMSGRLFVPRALEGRNLFTDPEAMRWESRFIRG
ncbi:MAG: beta-mannanase, partial [Lentisphaeria bacterium]|nr:beta-mannanase [Lentisphaeria bacterium]